jgi:hypothetical protein
LNGKQNKKIFILNDQKTASMAAAVAVRSAMIASPAPEIKEQSHYMPYKVKTTAQEIKGNSPSVLY